MKTALLALVLAVIASPAFAASDWNGTLVGNWDKGGDGVQIVMAGNTAIALYWHGDYVSDELRASLSGDGETLTIAWGPNGNASSAILTRENTDTAHVVMHEPGRGIVEFSVRLDHRISRTQQSARLIRFLWTTDSPFSTHQKIAGILFSRLGHLRTQERPKAPEKVTDAHLVPDGEGESPKRTECYKGHRKRSRPRRRTEDPGTGGDTGKAGRKRRLMTARA